MVCTVFIILAMTVISSMNARNLVVNSTRDLLAERPEPFMLNGEQAVVLADITLDQLLATTE